MEATTAKWPLRVLITSKRENGLTLNKQPFMLTPCFL